MLSLRQRITLGFAGLLALLLIVSALGIAVLRSHQNEVAGFIADNWGSVEWGHRMLDDLAQMDEMAISISGERRAPSAAELNGAAIAMGARAGDSTGPIPDFEKNCDSENHDITAPGEEEFAKAETLLWNGRRLDGVKQIDACYRDTFLRLLDPRTTGPDRISTFDKLRQLSARLRVQIRGMIDVNFNRLTPVNGHIQEVAHRARRLMIVLSVIGIGLAIAFVGLVRRSIIRPLRAITRSLNEIEKGNLEIAVQIRGQDELHNLAEAFNSMAAKLREYRGLDNARLARTRQATQYAIDSLPDAVVILSPDGTVEMANLVAQRLFAVRPDVHVSELTARLLAELHGRARESLKLIESSSYESAIQIIERGRDERWFLPRAVPILGERGQLLGVTIVLADVTLLRRQDEMKSSLLAVTSHELKTPLTSIRLGTHLLLEGREGPLTEKQHEHLVTISEESERLIRIIENLLDAARIQTDSESLKLEDCSPEALARDAINAVTAAYENCGIKLVCDVPGDLPQIAVDRNRIAHVFSNLLGNALKYTPSGGAVTVSAGVENESVQFSVSDNGPGIPARYQARVFDRFFRVPGGTSMRGTGLGLAIAREIVEAHGGEIHVKSEPSRGSIFSFTLPKHVSR